MLADAAYAYQQTAVLPAVRVIGDAFSVSSSWSAWMLSAYLMMATVATPALGRLADLHGRRRLLLGALAVFACGSVGAAVSPWFPLLVIFRGVQGVGGIVLPLSMSTLRDRLPPERVGVAIGLLIGAFSGGTVAGFALGGLITQGVSWRLVFGTGALVVALSLPLLARTVPGGGGSGTGRFDATGAALLGVSAVTGLVAVTVGPQLGWSSPLTLAFFSAAVVAGGWWAREQFTEEQPLLDLRLLRNKAVGAANLATVALGWGRFSVFLLLPDLIGSRPGHSGVGLAGGPLTVGLLMLPDALGQTVSGPLASPLAARFGGRRVLAGGLLLLCAGTAVLTATTTSEALVVTGALLVGLGAGLAVQTTSVVATQGIDEDLTGVSSSLNSTIRRYAGGVGSQVSTALLAALGAGSGATASPGRTAFAVTFAIASGMCLVGAAAGIAAGRRQPRGAAG
jgi:MFS family permease